MGMLFWEGTILVFACLMLGKSKKNILPNGGLMVVHLGKNSKKITLKRIKDINVSLK